MPDADRELGGTAPAPGRVLLVDDDPSILRALTISLRRAPWKISTAKSGAEALALLEEGAFEVVLSDHQMPGMSGVELLREVKARWPDSQRVMLTGQADHRVIEDAISRSEILRFLSKPWDENDLMATLYSAVEAANLARENRRLLQLTLQKNEELASLNASLELKVAERTATIGRAQREWEATFDALRDPIAIVDQNHRVLRANRAWARQGGTDFALGLSQPCFANLGRQTPCPDCPLASVWKGSESASHEVPWGNRLLVVTAFPWPVGSPEGAPWAVVTYQDVTEERRQADWRLHAERLAAVGRLAGGVAHEINNPLAGILAFAQILLGSPRPDDDLEALQLIEESALRCKRIVESLMRFAGVTGEGSRQHVDLRQVTSDTLALFGSALSRQPGTELIFTPGSEPLPTLLGDPQALGQALMDLLHHRLRALSDSGGTLTLKLATEDPLAGWTLIDTAQALSPIEIARLTDPEVSDGLGLGLAFRVAREHQGRLDVAPLGERGNCVRLLLGNLPLPSSGG